MLPERVSEDLPRYAAELQKRNLQLPLITTAITGPDSPQAQEILGAAKQLKVQFYRLGSPYHEKGRAVAEQIREYRARFKELAALNRQVRIGALVQNHSPAGRVYLAGDLAEMRELVRGFDPAEIGVAFDVGHALIVHGDGWREHFAALKPHIKIIYIKDALRSGGFVPFGQGELGKIGCFRLLREMGYSAPISMHIEFDWSNQGKRKTRAALLETLKQSRATLHNWLAKG